MLGSIWLLSSGVVKELGISVTFHAAPGAASCSMAHQEPMLITVGCSTAVTALALHIVVLFAPQCCLPSLYLA